MPPLFPGAGGGFLVSHDSESNSDGTRCLNDREALAGGLRLDKDWSTQRWNDDSPGDDSWGLGW